MSFAIVNLPAKRSERLPSRVTRAWKRVEPGTMKPPEMTPFFSSRSPTSPTLEPFGIFTATLPLPSPWKGWKRAFEEEQDDDQDDHGEDPERVAQQRAEEPAAPAAVFAVAPAVPGRARHRRVALVVEVLVLVEPVVVARRRRLPVPGAGLLHRSRRRRPVLAGRPTAARRRPRRSRSAGSGSGRGASAVPGPGIGLRRLARPAGRALRSAAGSAARRSAGRRRDRLLAVGGPARLRGRARRPAGSPRDRLFARRRA